MTKIFSYDEGQVLVTSTMEALGDQPFLCEVQHRGFPTKAYMVEATYPLNAAQAAGLALVDMYNIPTSISSIIWMAKQYLNIR